MTHAQRLGPILHARQPAIVPDGGRFVPVAFCALARIAATADGSSIATIAGLSVGTLDCSSAPSDVSAETSPGSPSANTDGFAVVVLHLSFVVRLADFSKKLKNPDWGSWERLLPDGSSLGGDVRPLRGAFQLLFTGNANPELYQTSFAVPNHLNHIAVPWSPSHCQPPMADWLPLVRQSSLLFRRHR